MRVVLGVLRRALGCLGDDYGWWVGEGVVFWWFFYVLDSLGFTLCYGWGMVGMEVWYWPWLSCVCLTEFFNDLFDVAVEFAR